MSESRGSKRATRKTRTGRGRADIEASLLEQLLIVACTSDLSHGAFRLYALLAGVASKRGIRDDYLSVSLAGLQKIHPGTSGKIAGLTTLIKQATELKRFGLLEMREPLHRNAPSRPIQVKALPPRPLPGQAWHFTEGGQLAWCATDGSPLTVSDVERAIES